MLDMEERWMSNGSDRKVNGVNGAEHISSFTSLNGVEHLEQFVNVAHPLEPQDFDSPIRCPPPEPCIMHDGRVWKDRILASSRRRSDLLGSMRDSKHIEYYSTPPHRRRPSRSKDNLQMPALIAPDLVVTKIVD